MDPSVTLFGPVDTYLAPYIVYVLFALILINVIARGIEYGQIRKQAADGVDAISRNPLRVATNFLLVIGGFYYLSVDRTGGLMVSLFVVGLFLTDFFEFEARNVEARQEIDIERPWAAIGISVFALLYIAFKAFFYLVAPFWNSIV